MIGAGTNRKDGHFSNPALRCAVLSAPWGKAEDFQYVNADAPRRLALAAREAGVVRFVHMDSPSIYFRFADQYMVKEAFIPPQRWITRYARSKWESEAVLRSLPGQMPLALILCPRAVFGEGDRAISPRRELGYEPAVSIDAGIRRFADDWRGAHGGRIGRSEHACA